MLKSTRTIGTLCALVTTATLATGCSSSGETATPSATAAAGAAESSAAEAGGSPSATGASMAATGEACSLLSEANVQAISGGPAQAQQMSAPGETYSIDACVWSDPAIGPLIALQVLTPGELADPLGTLLGASGETPTDYPALPDGQTWALGLLPGGGGVGYTVTWTAGGQQVALSVLGDPITDEVQQAVDSAATDVNTELGG